jgi:hypothetical protein
MSNLAAELRANERRGPSFMSPRDLAAAIEFPFRLSRFNELEFFSHSPLIWEKEQNSPDKP